MSTRYRDAGVDLETADIVTSNIQRHLGSALFGGFVPVPALKHYEHPVLVSSIDGIGTKVRLAAELGHVENLGMDIVHHCVNDIAVHGASPLFFLDYLAFHHLEPAVVDTIVTGITTACERLDIPLAGGETAEMPLVYPPGRFDVAGAVVGVVEQDAIVDGSDIRMGDVVIGFPSDGLHTNGYSLVQHLIPEDQYAHLNPTLGMTLGEALLVPHRCYLGDIQTLLKTGLVHGLAHITGGGIPGNLARIMPGGLSAVLDLPVAPPIFAVIKAYGVSRDEMTQVFNLGIGLIAVCAPQIVPHLPAECRLIGQITVGEREVLIHEDH